jgi:hypothetical protein
MTRLSVLHVSNLLLRDSGTAQVGTPQVDCSWWVLTWMFPNLKVFPDASPTEHFTLPLALSRCAEEALAGANYYCLLVGPRKLGQR